MLVHQSQFWTGKPLERICAKAVWSWVTSLVAIPDELQSGVRRYGLEMVNKIPQLLQSAL